MAVAEAPPLRRPAEERTSRPGLAREVARHWADYAYVAPAILVMLVVIGYPLVYTVWLSLHATPNTGGWNFNGVQNYGEILSSPRFWRTTWNTLYWTPSCWGSGRRWRCTSPSVGAAWCGPCCSFPG